MDSGLLVSPGAHALSLRLAAEVESVANDPPHGVLRCCVRSAGLVELLLQASRESGFGAREWPLLVGGEGVGDDPSVAAAIGTAPRSPVAVRFGVPIPLDEVDDTGCCDASFWALGMREHPTLRCIAARAVEWLEAPPHDPVRRERWMAAAAAAAAKTATVAAYRRIARTPELVNSTGQLRPEYFADPRVGRLLCPEPCSALPTHPAAARHAALVPPPAPEALVAALAPEAIGDGIFRFNLLAPAFCTAVAAEVAGFEASALPRRRVNSMNRGGAVLSDLGMEPLMTELARRLVAPLAAALYSAEPFGGSIDHHHSFVVAYRHSGGDRGLDLHHDASEVWRVPQLQNTRSPSHRLKSPRSV